MANILTIDLQGHIPGGASIEFLSVEMSVKPFIPIALIWYSLQGVKKDYGLRLDLDKGVFLDHFEDNKKKEEILEKAAPKIVELVSEEFKNEIPIRSSY